MFARGSRGSDGINIPVVIIMIIIVIITVPIITIQFQREKGFYIIWQVACELINQYWFLLRSIFWCLSTILNFLNYFIIDLKVINFPP